MPRIVVPMASPLVDSFSRRSSSKCQGKITWARVLTIRFLATSTPRLTRLSISCSRLAGLMTTPAAMTHCTSGRKMPLGTSESLNVCPSMTTVGRRWPRPGSGRRYRAAR